MRTPLLVLMWGSMLPLALDASAQQSSAPAAAAPAAPAPAAPSALEHFLAGLTTLRLNFTQSVVDAKGATVETGAGKLLVLRPDRFRWEYAPQGAGGGTQVLVADGKNLWFYDPELSQATVKPQSAALTATPVVLLSGTPAELQAAFIIENVAPRDSLEWVRVTPRSRTAEFAHAELGFQGLMLARMQIADDLGQIVTVIFTDGIRNAPLGAPDFAFTAPKGTDVIGTPQH
jgi:outer membrane lipoprotein carrier protein